MCSRECGGMRTYVENWPPVSPMTDNCVEQYEYFQCCSSGSRNLSSGGGGGGVFFNVAVADPEIGPGGGGGGRHDSRNLRPRSAAIFFFD